MIDWNLLLETDEHSPRRVSIITRHYNEGWPNPTHYTIKAVGSERRWGVQYNGTPSYPGIGPSVRNVAQPTLRTSDECLQRMEALVRRMAEERRVLRGADYDEARKIVEMLPVPPVDPDLIEARKIAADQHTDSGITRLILNGDRDDCGLVTATLAALKRGRELAAQ